MIDKENNSNNSNKKNIFKRGLGRMLQNLRQMMKRITKSRDNLSQEITERKIIEENLHKLSQAVEQSPSSVMITNIEGNIEYINPKFTELTGYTSEEALGQTPRILKSGKLALDKLSALCQAGEQS